MTSPPKMPTMRAPMWFGICAVAVAAVLLFVFHPWNAAAPLTDEQARMTCMAYKGPKGDPDREHVLKMYGICNQALESFKKKDAPR